MERINVQVRVAPLDCYSCGAETQMIASIGLSSGNEDIDCSITDFSDYPELAAEVAEAVKDKAAIGEIKRRLSRTMERSYMSNGCAHCDAIFGAHYEIHSRYDEVVMAEFVSEATGRWGQLFDALMASEDGHLL